MSKQLAWFWTRRRFVTSAAVAATLSLADRKALAQHANGPSRPRSAATSPEEIAGATRGLMIGATSRPLRYRPIHGGFVIEDGREFFNRPLYGPNNPFRVDAGDLPEFSLYMPGHGGNLRLGIAGEHRAKWLFEADSIRAEYRAGQMHYAIQDPLWAGGELRIEVFTLGAGSGLHVCITPQGIPQGTKLIWAFGGASGRKGKRGGDIGCEVEPVTRFFQVRPAECKGNLYTLNGSNARLQSKVVNLEMLFPQGSQLKVSDGNLWNEGWMRLEQAAHAEADLPVLIGSVTLSDAPLQMLLRKEVPEETLSPNTWPAMLEKRKAQLDKLAAAISVETPDEFVNAMGGALCIAGDALWDSKQQCVMHGAVAWRMPLAGWRGPYVLDSLGWHDRFREHARHWIARQTTSPVTTASPAIGKPDAGSHLSRSENMLHSRGDISHNHYDMNLVFFDAVLRHLQWTGDVAFAKEIWPALVMHLAWEQRMFRRLYEDGHGRQLPLYEGYACIWASDNLQYNGGGAAHATAYNFYAHRMAAEVAGLIGEDETPYRQESELIHEGMRELLWVNEQGTFGESRDLLGPQTVYTAPALWSVYHTIDSRVTTPIEAWQMAEERLAALKKVPVEGENVPAGGYMLSCSDWLPYIWSLNLLLLAENMHFALSLWQAGMAEEAFRIFKGNLLDSMFVGLCPGNFHMTSQLDVHRQEAQRDFGDPIGISSRALVEGLFGVQPEALNGRVVVQPGFPADWDHASLRHADFEMTWHRHGSAEVIEMTPHFSRPLRLLLRLRAPLAGRPHVTVNGKPVSASFDAAAVGTPIVVIDAPAAASWKVEVEWRGEVVPAHPARITCTMGEKLPLPPGISPTTLRDPQGCLHDGHIAAEGMHTVFAKRTVGACTWWVPISFEVKKKTEVTVHEHVEGQVEHIDLSAHLQHQVSSIFQRQYVAPRSPYCSLSIPEQGAGAWAAFDLQPEIDDSGLRAAGGVLKTPSGVAFATPSDPAAPNCRFLSYWQQDQPRMKLPLSGSAKRLCLLMAGSTFPQCSRMTHAVVRVRYTDGTASEMELRNPENWWPIEQDYLLDDYLFVDNAPIPPRVDLKTGKVRILDPMSFKGKGRSIPGGAANVLKMELHDTKRLEALEIEVKLYGIVVGLLAASLVR